MPEKTDIRLNLGAGRSPMPGYDNLDLKTGTEIGALPHEDGSVDEIRASHVLEHESYHRTKAILAHWYAKLKPGGIVKIAVPNLEYVIDAMEKGATDEPLEGYIMGGQTDEHDQHRSFYTYNKLEVLLRCAGFECVVPWESDFDDCSKLPVSLNLMATKPEYPAAMTNVCVLMSVPRQMFTDNVLAMHRTIQECRMQLIATQGCFWGQCLERCMEDAMKAIPTCEYFMTCDYDSIFSVDQVRQLYRLARRTNADAIFPVQCKRSAEHAMVTIRQEDGVHRRSISVDEARQEALRVTTGHFGMTLIKVAALKSLPKPWFKEVPDADGGWGDGHIDPDIWFWNQWDAAGKTLYQANHVRIGHAQLVATFPDRQWRPIHVHMNDYNASGVPIFAR